MASKKEKSEEMEPVDMIDLWILKRRKYIEEMADYLGMKKLFQEDPIDE